MPGSKRTLFGVPQILMRAGLARTEVDATTKAKLLLITISIIFLLLATWLAFGADDTAERAEPYYNYADETDAR